MKKYDVTALGELLIDFTVNGSSRQGNPLYEANPGGAPCNVLAILAGLGHKTAFVGKVGRDIFGQQLEAALQEAGIETAYLQKSGRVPTTLAFVHRRKDGDRDFSFYREPGADMLLEETEIPQELLKNSRIFHFGTLSMTHAGVRRATKRAVQLAVEAGALISFDPNLRPPLWNSLEAAKRQVQYGLAHCQILKISGEELQWFTGMKDYMEGVKKIRRNYPIPLILVTLGKEGSRAYYQNMLVEADAFVQKKTVDTTGAGDTFMGCILHFVLEYGLTNLTRERLEDMLVWANAAAALVTARKGALRVMPRREEVERLLKSR